MLLTERYAKLLRETLEPVCDKIEQHLKDKLKDTPYIDRISSRAKDISSFVKKASQTTSNGTQKYAEPFEQIQDMIGARIVVFYPQTIEFVNDKISTFFVAFEEQEKQPNSHNEFGYEGKHFILRIPSELLPDDIPEDFPDCFELQIKTLFQHAFSEASHDLIYKPNSKLTPEQQKRSAYAAASAWGADQVLSQLVGELLPDYPSKE